MQCPTCGYEMSPQETTCPRCKIMGKQDTKQPPQMPAPGGQPPGMPVPAYPEETDNTSGTDGPVPHEVQRMGWSWGGFALTWVWGLGNRVWIALLALIPIVNIAVAIWLGVSGHAMAWRKRRFRSIAEFESTMRAWNNWGLGLLLASILLGLFGGVVGGMVATTISPVFTRANAKATQASCQSNLKQIALGMIMFAQDHGETLPASATWNNDIYPYVRNESIFLCPGGAGYAMNAAVSGVNLTRVKSPAATVLIYECDKDAKPLCVHDGYMNVAYVDGHVKAVPEASVSTLVWNP